MEGKTKSKKNRLSKMYSHQNLLHLGQILKERREDQGLSLRKISEWTKISASTLQAIEEAKADSLPAYVYLRGFILSYAKALGMDEKEVEKELKTLLSPKEPEGMSPPSSHSPESFIEKDMRLTPIILAVSILFVIFCILALSSYISSYKKEKTSESSFSLEEKRELKPLKKPLSLTNKKDVQKPPGREEKPLPESSSLPLKKQVVQTQPLEVVVKAIGEVKVFYKVDKGAMEEVSLSEDQFEVLKAQENIFIRTNYSDLVYIFLNGEDQGPFGSGGEKEKYFYPEKEIKIKKKLKEKER